MTERGQLLADGGEGLLCGGRRSVDDGGEPLIVAPCGEEDRHPAWKGGFGSEAPMVDGARICADGESEGALREAEGGEIGKKELPIVWFALIVKRLDWGGLGYHLPELPQVTERKGTPQLWPSLSGARSSHLPA